MWGYDEKERSHKGLSGGHWESVEALKTGGGKDVAGGRTGREVCILKQSEAHRG